MARDLESMKQELYEVFDMAVSQGKRYSTSSIGPELLKAAAETARAIAAIEAEQRVQAEITGKKPDLLRKPAA